MLLVVVAVLVSFVWYILTPVERARVVRAAVEAARRLPGAIRPIRSMTAGGAEPESLRQALHARTPHVYVTPALAAAAAVVFAGMLAGAGSLADPDTLVRWGASYGPRTTSGEWFRLLTALFVHAGPLHLLVNLAALLTLGPVLERLVRPLAFAAVFVAAGAVSIVVSLSLDPVGVHGGASGAVSGLYGLLIAAVLWGLVERSALTISLATLKNLVPVAAAFVLYNAATGELWHGATRGGFLAGLGCGLLFARRVGARTPPMRQIVAATVATLVIVAGSAAPLRGLVDVRPEIEQVMAVEHRTAAAYDAAVGRFRHGTTTAAALAEMIDREIVPELAAAQGRLGMLGRVPEEHRPLVAAAEEYLRLRTEGWQIRSTALRTSTAGLKQADQTQRAALDVLETLRRAQP
jgi:membrane associated rhomboid family serine protease